MRIAIIAASEFAVRLTHYIEQYSEDRVIGYFDDYQSTDDLCNGRPVLGPIAAVKERFENDDYDATLVAIGYKHRAVRATVYDHLVSANIPRYTFVHPDTSVDPTATIGDGCFVGAGNRLDYRSRLDCNVYVAHLTYIGHDVFVGAHTFCSANVTFCGEASIGERCFIGASSTVLDSASVGDDATVGAGAVVLSTVLPGSVVIGVPARPKNKNKSG